MKNTRNEPCGSIPGTHIATRPHLNDPPMRIQTLVPTLLLLLQATAQTEVRQSTFPFSDGSHPTFVVVFDGADAGAVESWYKGQLKGLSNDLEDKKEIRATGARAPEVNPDTITIWCKVEKPKKSTAVSLHLAFKVNGAFVAASSDKQMIEGARNFCYSKAVAYKTLLLQAQVETEEKTLARLQGELTTLGKDHSRYGDGIEKNQEKRTQASQDKVQAEADLKSNELAVQAKQNDVATSPSEGNTKALQDLIKEQAKLKDRIDRLGNQILDAEDRVKGLEQSIARNLEEQEAKRKAIEVQQQKLTEAQTALKNVN